MRQAKRRCFMMCLCLLLPVSILLSACGPVHQNVKPTSESIHQIKRLAVVLPEGGDFTVYYERATATGTGAAMFGLIGAAVASSYNESKDREKADALRPGLKDISCLTLFRDSLQKTILESKRFPEVRLFEKAEVKPEDISKFDAVVTFTIKSWGIRLVERGSTERVASFVELEAKMVNTSRSQELWNEHQTIIGQGKHRLADFESDPALVRKEIVGVAENAGYKMASTLIYQ